MRVKVTIKLFQKLILIICFVFLLSGCKTQVNTDIYSSDLFSTVNVTTPASLKLAVPTCNSDKLPEYEKSVLALFDQTSNAKVIGCERERMDSMLVVAFQAEIASETSNADLILFRHVLENEELEVRGIKPVFGQSFLQRVQSLLKESMQRLEYDDLRFSVTINNDNQSPVYITGSNLWIDGEPYDEYYRQELNRREKIIASFPDITSDLMLKGKQPVVIWIHTTVE